MGISKFSIFEHVSFFYGQVFLKYPVDRIQQAPFHDPSLACWGGCKPFPSLADCFLYLKYFAMLMKLHPSEQNLVTNIFKSKWHPDVTLEVKVRKLHKVLIFNDNHNLKTRIYRESNGQGGIHFKFSQILWWRHFHHWCKFQLHTMCESWDYMSALSSPKRPQVC